jgi:cbb3-type cytochrome oxidase maturation protein
VSYLFLIPVSIALGLTGLAGFFWALRHDQYDDLDGAAARILLNPDVPATPKPPGDSPAAPPATEG